MNIRKINENILEETKTTIVVVKKDDLLFEKGIMETEKANIEARLVAINEKLALFDTKELK